MFLRTRVIAVDPQNPDPAILAEAAVVILDGRLVAFATETVYGLGADATNPKAVEGIFLAKGRPSSNPLIVHVESVTRARSCVTIWDDRAEQLATRFWPGPLTLVLPRSGLIPDITAGHLPTVGVRIPEPAVARGMIAAADRPIAAPSANRSNRISPTLAAHVLHDLDGRIDLILDSGATSVGVESTVLDLTSRTPRILRPGAITQADLSDLLGIAVEEFDPTNISELAISPGNLPVHYAPQTPCLLVRPQDLAKLDLSDCALIQFGPEICDHAMKTAKDYHLVTLRVATRDLYATLHICDKLGVRAIVIVAPPAGPEWVAIRDRVTRASQPLSQTSAAGRTE